MLIRVHNVALGARGEGFSVRLSWIDFEFFVRRWLFLFEKRLRQGSDVNEAADEKGRKEKKAVWKSIKGSKWRNVHNKRRLVLIQH